MKESGALQIEILERDKIYTILSRIFFMSPSLMAVNRLKDHVILDVNHRFIRFTGYSREEIIGRSFTELDVFSREDYQRFCNFLKTKGSIYNERVEYRTKYGKMRMGIYSAELIDACGDKLVFSINHDVTERIHAQEALKQREEELIRQSMELEKANTAIRVFLERRREDMKELESKLQQNINELVIPYIRELENYNLNEKGKYFLRVLESNLKDIVSPFVRNISSHHTVLTPTEIKVANMVKNGMTSKDIAKLLGISIGTVDSHRNNIRKKLGLKNSKVNLQSHLLSLS